MRLDLSDEQALIASSVQDFLASEYGFARRQRSLQAPHACDPGMWRHFAEMGWLGLALPESAGGLGVGALEAGLLMRAFGRHLVVEPYSASALRATPLLAALARDEQRDAWLPSLLDGSVRAALAHEEPAAPLGSLPLRTTARRHPGGWIVNGQKQLVAGADGADLLLVSAVVAGSQEQRVFLLTPRTPGVHMQPARTSDGGQASDLRLEQVQLQDADLVGTDADATVVLRLACARHLVALCWEASGAMAAMVEQTASYVQQREQFGQPLGKFQVVAHRLAEMAVCSEEALAACELAALRIDAGAPDVVALASMAKSKVGRESRFVAQQAVQLHGAMGVTEELPIASYFRKLTLFAQQGGSTAAHSRLFGAAMLRDAGWHDSRTMGPVADEARA